jgi:extradiol dioxygenase family protein
MTGPNGDHLTSAGAIIARCLAVLLDWFGGTATQFYGLMTCTGYYGESITGRRCGSRGRRTTQKLRNALYKKTDQMNTFHYAFKVKDLSSTRKFYVQLLGCEEGRSTESWVDFNFFGHQLSAHVSDSIPGLDYCGTVDGVAVPIPHFGCVLTEKQFSAVRAALESADVEFIVSPQTRYAGTTGQQQTMFVLDYSGNPLEFKSFAASDEIFAR